MSRGRDGGMQDEGRYQSQEHHQTEVGNRWVKDADS